MALGEAKVFFAIKNSQHVYYYSWENAEAMDSGKAIKVEDEPWLVRYVGGRFFYSCLQYIDANSF